MPTTRPGYAPTSEKNAAQTLEFRYGMTEHMATDQSHDSAVDRAAHAAIYYADRYGDDPYALMRSMSKVFGVEYAETFERVLVVNDITKSPNTV